MTRKKKNKLTEEGFQHILLTLTAYREFFGSDMAGTAESEETQEDLMKVADLAEIAMAMAAEAGSYEDAKDIVCAEFPFSPEMPMEETAGMKSLLLRMLMIHYGIRRDFEEELKTVLTPEEIVIVNDFRERKKMLSQISPGK